MDAHQPRALFGDIADNEQSSVGKVENGDYPPQFFFCQSWQPFCESADNLLPKFHKSTLAYKDCLTLGQRRATEEDSLEQKNNSIHAHHSSALFPSQKLFPIVASYSSQSPKYFSKEN